ncbi:major facilitator family transporter, putative [Lunatimonas lonarensis]|uniref:Major facilitator family transporter, putative n=1 Tax=Lunatimonas lonarensis TaxID=1232681 RepID=R7ZZB0_9BACT|nr:major facilitator family transporter, putative [Lunatimonas lonarensis]
MHVETRRPAIYNLNFFLLCTSYFLFFTSFNMIIPELPAYLTSLGGEDHKGLIISLFTLSAGLSRPFSGKLADRVGRIPVMVIGVVVCVGVSLLYPILTTVGGFLFLRFLHGFSTGFTPTGSSAYLADIIPFQKRGEAMGIQSLFGSLGMAAGPALGGYIGGIWGVEPLFYLSAAISFLSIAILSHLKETLQTREKPRWSHLKLSKSEIIETRVWAPSLILVFSVFSFGVVLTVIPDYSDHLGLENRGLFFAVFTISSLAIRVLAGRASDRFGRIPVLKAATLTMVVAMWVVAEAKSTSMLLVGAVLYGCSIGMNNPTITAWTVDLSLERFRGKALATMYIALEAGIGLGALVSGWIFANQAENFSAVFTASAATAGVAFLLLWFIPKTKDPHTPKKSQDVLG